MKQAILTTMIALGLTGSVVAQETVPVPATGMEQKPFQITLFGGLSMPTGTYSGAPGKAKNGINGGLALDYFFNNSNWGIGIDARYQQHKLKAFNTDSNAAGSYIYTFQDGYTTFTQKGNAFQHIALSLGPVYRTRFGAFDLNVFARVGALMQQYPQYQQDLYAMNPFTAQYEHLITPVYTDNSSDKPLALMGLAGARLVYNINSNLGIVLQADYLSSFGKAGKFTVTQHEQTAQVLDGSIKFWEEPEGSRNYVNNVDQYFRKETTSSTTPITNMNISLGLQLRFGNSSKRSHDNSGGNQSKGAVETIVMVKDKKTGLALGGVKVQIKDAGGVVYTGITDANGMINTKLAAKDYTVGGDKNGVATTSAQIAQTEFKGNNVYKELFHDDERFTLVGETIDCKTGHKISGIEVNLTQGDNGAMLTQISDKEGRFNFQLDPKKDYNIVASERGKFSQTELVTTKGLDRSKTLYVTLKLGVCDLKEGEAFVVKNIFYDFDASAIRPDAAIVLNNIVRVMKANPRMTIELSSHTDSRGDRQYNQTLSQQRAEAAVNYLVSKGIARKRLVAKGYGENRLVNNCADGTNCTEEEHEQNRRTEIKVLKY
ncbi:OmpA family protein [Edaphocola flava]|uniref:OmpA family protein n=1 Tax=Edaphocola flava TaxID=2499629 RepID=UPI00192A60DA|nr:OmpA family protein [Edaphocola flava]